jgi:branched-chain amino acid transport system permease protein
MKINEKKWPLRLDVDDLRLVLTCFFGGLLLAVMTGPEGNVSSPGFAFQHSIFSSHVYGFVIFGIALGAISVVRRKSKMGIWELPTSLQVKTIRERQASFTSSNPTMVYLAFGVIALILALLVADFTGPLVPNKFSFAQIFHQFVNSRTYGYITIFEAPLVIRFVRSRTTTNQAVANPWFTSNVAAITFGAVGGFLFALFADPWLPPRFRWSYFTFGGPSNNAFLHHWTTYLWIVVGVLIGLRYVVVRIGSSRRSLTSKFRRPRANVSASTRFVLYAGCLFIAVEAPKYLNAFWQSTIYQQIGIFVLLALGLNIVIGFAGLLDLGYVAFYALGAYTNAYFTGALPIHPPFVLNTFLVIPIAVIVAMLAGVLLGLPTLRLRGDYLAIVTLGFGEIVYVLISNLTSITDGAGGTAPAGQFSINLPGIHYTWSGAITGDLNYYYLILAFIVPILFLFNSLNNSKVGRSWAAIREDEVAASSLGINPLKYKVMAFAIGASTSGVAGVLSSSKLGALFPSDFALQLSIFVVILVIFGGMGSIVGVLVGAAFLNWVTQYLIFHSFIDYQDADKYMYFGALLILAMIFRPQGLVPSRRRLREFDDEEAGLGSADAMGTAAEGPLS